ncbi:MEDS domain-containing protein [Streptomyces sp. NPDC005803]|uniref:MEDS domain-containing protein n=1 Tax=Streptomyces sp. NPDC005803 TaxID=3154297 RepID=UPI0034101685
MHRRTAETLRASVASVSGSPLAAGDHVCALYRGRAERDRLVAPYFADGLDRGHTCLFLAAEGEGPTFRDVLTAAGTADGRGLENLQVKGPAEYLQNGTFDGDRTLARMYAWSDETFPGGNGALARLATDMSWARPLVQPSFVRALVRYEVNATRWLRSYPQVGMCMYDLDVFRSDVVLPLVKAHPLVWLNGMIMENPYCPAPGKAPGATAAAEG